jgi:dipeptidyl aminopeptidase/acylaminoacyl peptidase
MQRKLIPRSLLFADLAKSSVQLGPDGVHVGYLANWAGQPALWTAPVPAPAAAKRISTDDPVVAWRWAEDGEHALVIYRRNVGERLAAIRLSDGAAHDFPELPAGAQSIACLSRGRPEAALVSVAAEDEQCSGVYLVPIRGGLPTRIMGLDGFTAWFADPSLTVRAASKRCRQQRTHSLFRRTAAGAWVLIADYAFPDRNLAGVLSISADGRTLYIIDNRKTDKASLNAVDVETGAEDVLLECPIADLVPEEVMVNPADGRIQSVCSYFVRLHRHYLDSSLMLDFETLATVRPGEVSVVGRSTDDRHWLVRFMNGGPLDYLIYDRDSKQTRHLFSDQPDLDAYPKAQRYAAVVPARDGLALPCDIYLPPGADGNGDGRPDGPLPAILYVHGGPWT